MRSIIQNSAAAAVVALAGLTSAPATSMEAPRYHGVPNFLVFQDVQEHLGMVPEFFFLFPDEELAGIWDAYKRVQVNPGTALDAKTKQLIGLAVAAQAECSPCIYFQASAAMASGADFREIQETVAISAIGEAWSEVLGEDTFAMVKRDTDALVRRGAFDAPTASN
jgi:AhpD family alkylhydroperoxidase